MRNRTFITLLLLVGCGVGLLFWAAIRLQVNPEVLRVVICRNGMRQGRLPILIVVRCGGKVGLPRRRTTERSAFPATLRCLTRWHGPRYDRRSMRPLWSPPRKF